MTTTQIKRLICDQLNIIANATHKINSLNNLLKDETNKYPSLDDGLKIITDIPNEIYENKL